MAVFAAGDVAGLIKVSASARRAAPTDNISVAAAASPSRRIGCDLKPNLLGMEFSLDLDSGIRCSFSARIIPVQLPSLPGLELRTAI